MTVPNRHLDLINGHLITEPRHRPLRSGDNWRNPRIAAGEIWIVMGEVTGSLRVDHLGTTHPRYWWLATLKCPSVVNVNYLAHHNHQTRKQQVISPRRKQIFRGWGGLFLSGLCLGMFQSLSLYLIFYLLVIDEALKSDFFSRLSSLSTDPNDTDDVRFHRILRIHLASFIQLQQTRKGSLRYPHSESLSAYHPRLHIPGWH